MVVLCHPLARIQWTVFGEITVGTDYVSIRLEVVVLYLFLASMNFSDQFSNDCPERMLFQWMRKTENFFLSSRCPDWGILSKNEKVFEPFF